MLTVSVKGPATIVAFGNADIKDFDRYTDNAHRAWKGRALLIVKSMNKAGKMEVTVKGEGETTERMQIKSK